MAMTSRWHSIGGPLRTMANNRKLTKKTTATFQSKNRKQKKRDTHMTPKIKKKLPLVVLDCLATRTEDPRPESAVGLLRCSFGYCAHVFALVVVPITVIDAPGVSITRHAAEVEHVRFVAFAEHTRCIVCRMARKENVQENSIQSPRICVTRNRALRRGVSSNKRP